MLKALTCVAPASGLMMSIIAVVMAMHGHLSWDQSHALWYYDPHWNWQALIGYAIFAFINAIALVRESR